MASRPVTVVTGVGGASLLTDAGRPDGRGNVRPFTHRMSVYREFWSKPMPTKSLWGDLSDIEIVRTPKEVLNEQANALTAATRASLWA